MCDKCNERAATVVITQILGDKSIKLYLCEKCAAESEGLLLENQNSFQHFLSELINAKGYKNQTLVCEKCGMTIDSFRKNSKVGCSNCYSTFGGYFEPFIKRIHTNIEHTGKIPGKNPHEVNKNQLINKLQNELNTAISNEEYELAAKLRDEIRNLRQGEN